MDHLDTLQRELSRTLEHIGHVLAATNDKTVLAAAAKLKHNLPQAQDNFQNALDNLSGQIEHAQLVLRRDLALQTETISAPAPPPVPVPAPPAKELTPVKEATPPKAASPTTASGPQASTTIAQSNEFDLTTPDDSDQPPVDQPPVDQPSADQPPTVQPSTDQPSTDQPSTDQPSADQLQPDPPTQDSQPPDTSDNDNISALLPGLQDYANNQPEGSGDPDFDDIFGTGDFTTEGMGGGAESGDAMEGMDNFLDFDFGAALGDGGDGGDDANGLLEGSGNGNGNGNGNMNLDDEFDFFKFD